MGFNLDEAGNIFQMQKISRQWKLWIMGTWVDNNIDIYYAVGVDSKF